MGPLLYIAALFLILVATGGFVVFIVTQRKAIYKYSYMILVIGFIVHTLSLGYQYYLLGATPVLTLKEALAFFSWIIIGVYLIFHLRYGLRVLGSFIVPLAAIFMIISSVIPSTDVTLNPVLKSIWLPFHVFTIFLGDGMFAMAFIAAIMYLLQERHIKQKVQGSFYSRLPSLETLDSINHYAIIWGFPFLTLGMITGAMYAHSVFGSFWQWDPKEVWSLITWLSYAVLLHERLAMGWGGRKAAIFSVICFLILLFTFIGGSLWLSGYHSFSSLEGGVGL